MKNIAIYTISISPHITSYWKIFQSSWNGEVSYFYKTAKHDPEREKIGWQKETVENAVFVNAITHSKLKDVDILIESMRDIALIENRLKRKLWTFYSSERWFKPPIGFLRLLIPSYFRMAYRFVKNYASPYMFLMPQGIHSARDMARLINFIKGDICALFVAPKLAFESRPGGLIVPLKDAIKANLLSKEEIKFANRYGFVQIPKVHWGKVKPQGAYSKMRLWGYFVESTKKVNAPSVEKNISKVLWVGRMLGWKRVKDLIKACGDKVTLSIYGNGPQKGRLKTLSRKRKNIDFNDFVSKDEVRELMHSHNVYVLPSNSYEGWGAVVSEALEEGMKVVGTIDAGSTATILPPTHLYKAGDVRALRDLLSKPINDIPFQEWSAENAAKALKAMLIEITGVVE